MRQVKAGEALEATVFRIGEPVQSDEQLLQQFDQLGIRPGTRVNVSHHGSVISITRISSIPDRGAFVALPESLGPHLFLEAHS